MSYKLMEYVVRVDHVPGCEKSRLCGPACARVTDGWMVELLLKLPNVDKPVRRRERIPAEWSETKTKRGPWAAGREVFLLEQELKALREGPPAKKMTVAELAEEWLKRRKAREVRNVDVEEQRLRAHILPLLGTKKLTEIRTRHALELIEALQATKSRRGGRLAPRTVRQVYFTFHQVIRYAVRIEALAGNPIELERGEVPAIVDKDPLWRESAVFTASEVEQLISDERITAHRRVVYALEFFTGLRTGEVSALRWGDYEQEMEPLGRITSARSWDSKRKLFKDTKTHVVHVVPAHPVLAKVLAVWKLKGWEHRYGRKPTAEDLVVPTIKGTPKDVRTALMDFHEDLQRLGLRKRRQYDSRRSFISLGLDGGASKEILKFITHPRPSDAFDLYRTPSWEARCQAVKCIKAELRGEGQVLVLRPAKAANGFGAGLAEALVQVPEKEKTP